MGFEEEIFVCVDCESTGLDPEKDVIIEVAVAVFDFMQVHEEYETLIDPGCSIPVESTAIHNITDEMVIGKPKIGEVLEKVLHMIGKHVIVGHNIEFDIALLVNAAKKEKIPCTIDKNPFLDTLRMARLYGGSSQNSLQKLREHFHIEEEGAHRAMSDVIVNREVFQRLAHNYKSIKELQKALSKPILLKQMPLGKHKGRAFRDIPVQYLRWMADKDFDEDLLYSIRSELNRRKKGNSFEQTGNPFLEL